MNIYHAIDLLYDHVLIKVISCLIFMVIFCEKQLASHYSSPNVALTMTRAQVQVMNFDNVVIVILSQK